jgi:DNA-binding NarL/FixJ family response regulator
VGWHTVRANRWEVLDADVRHDRGAGVVLVVDELGRLPAGPPHGVLRSSTAAVVALGRRSDLRALVGAIERGAVAALDVDRPFTDLVRALDELLRHPSSWPDRRELLARLRRRAAEAATIGALTARELEVLCALMRGLSAAEIAREAHVALPTVRSHIRAILTKTGVSSQVAAVARAHASGAEPAVEAQRRELHQF